MRLRRLVAIPLALSLVLMACGDDDDDAADEPIEDASADDLATDDPADDAAGGDAGADDGADAIEVVGIDYGYENLPAEAEVGTRMTFRNDSSEEVHEIVLLRLDDGEERPLEEILQLPRDEQEAITETIAVNVAFPESEGFPAMGELVLEEEGRYVAACFIPQGADPEEYREAAENSQGGPPDVAGGPPHVALGMVGEIVVGG